MKKYNHGNHCHEQWNFFSPFVIYIDGILGREAPVILANLSRLVAAKMDESILHVSRWINGWFTISASRSYSQIIHRARLPSTLQERETDWDMELGLGLAQ